MTLFQKVLKQALQGIQYFFHWLLGFDVGRVPTGGARKVRYGMVDGLARCETATWIWSVRVDEARAYSETEAAPLASASTITK